MSVEQIEQSLLKLGSEERLSFAHWFFEHEEELLGAGYVHPAVEAEILHRREEALAHPEKLESWDTAFPRIEERLKTS